MEGVFFQVGAGFDLDQPPATVAAALQDVHSHEHAAVLERGFIDRRDFRVGDQFPRVTQRLIEPA